MTEYEQGKARLIEHVKGLLTPLNMTDERKRVQDLADRLNAITEELDELWFDLEFEHDKPPEKGVRLDGMPIEYPDYGCSFQGTLSYMRDLAASAQRVAESYPNPRKRHALPAAATGLVSLWYAHEKPRPSLYVAGPAVAELASLCAAAGIEVHDGTAPVPKGRKRVRIKGAVTADRLRGELTDALTRFDPTFQPTWVHHVLTGRWEW